MIPHSKPTLPTEAEWAEVTGRLAPGWAADGPCVAAFAQDAAAWLGAVGGVAVNSGSSALHVALLALGATAGTEVLVPAYCCVALLNAVALAGAEPVLVDAEPGGFNMCPEDARRRVTPRTRAVIVAHMFGVAAALEPFLALGPPVIEDCAQSLGAWAGDSLAGSQGAVSIGSFYATKVITTGTGGLAASSDVERLAMLRNLTEYDNQEEWRLRLSYKMGELEAALGLWQIERLPGFLVRRAETAAYYDRELDRQPMPPTAIAYRYTLRTPDADAALDALQALGIGAKRPVYRPLHHYLGGDYPHAQAAHDQIVSLPIYPSLTDSEAEQVVGAVRSLGLG